MYIQEVPRPRRNPTKRDRPNMTSLELPAELKAGLDAVRERDGVPNSEQIRRAIRAWLEAKGIDVGGSVGQRARKPTKGRRA